MPLGGVTDLSVASPFVLRALSGEGLRPGLLHRQLVNAFLRQRGRGGWSGPLAGLLTDLYLQIAVISSMHPSLCPLPAELSLCI